MSEQQNILPEAPQSGGGTSPCVPANTAPPPDIFPSIATIVLLAGQKKQIGPNRFAEIHPLTFNRARIVVTDAERYSVFDGW